MKKYIVVLISIIFVVSTLSFATDNPLTGVKKCKMCHKGDSKGNIFETWEGSAHANAYATLAGDKAKEIYTKLAKTGLPQEDPACLKCHVSGYELADELKAKMMLETGVTCESCHGPAGGGYWKKSTMQDHAKSVAAGMVDKPKESCVKCHNDSSPTFKEFKFEEMWEKIKHATPEKQLPFFLKYRL